jgi:ABC-2 type transport system ATP-binding protein
MTKNNGIRVIGLKKIFGSAKPAVNEIHLEVAPGEIYGFLGPNGAGKSTTVLMLTTLLPPTSGTASIAGYDLRKEGVQVRRTIGAALQEVALDPFLNGREHMELQAALHGLSRAEGRRRGEALLERVGLTEAAERKTAGYSGGMKRRLDLALALMHGPSVLFLDEPTTGLDPQSRLALWNEVRRLSQDEGVTVFLTTQYLEEADQLAKRVGIIDGGVIVAEDTPEALKAEIGAPSVEIIPAKSDQAGAIAEILAQFGTAIPAKGGGQAVRLRRGVNLTDIVRALDAQNLAAAQLMMDAPTLDDVFLQKTGHNLEGGKS